jgi:hypothetical protein
VVGGNSCLVEGEVDIDLGTSAVRLIRMATAEVNVCYATTKKHPYSIKPYFISFELHLLRLVPHSSSRG